MIDSLFPKVRQDIFAATFMHPDKEWSLSDLARHVHRTPSSLQRELESLVHSGVLVRRVQGTHIAYQPDRRCPVYGDLKSITLKTVGLSDVLRAALEPLQTSIQWAFLYGSIARHEERSLSDIDLMVIGSLSFRELVTHLYEVQQRVQREINPTVFPWQEFSHRFRTGDAFLKRVLEGPKMFLIGECDELERTLGSP